MKKLILIITILIITGCSSGITKINYINKSVSISAQDDILLLPSVVIKEIKTGKNDLETMYDTLSYTLLKNKNLDVIAAESIYEFLKSKEIKILPENKETTKKIEDISLDDFKKLEFKAIHQKQMNQLRKKFNAKYFIKLNIISYPKEDLMNENHIFISLKLYSAIGDEIIVLNSHYQGEHGVGSSTIVKMVEEMINLFIKQVN